MELDRFKFRAWDKIRKVMMLNVMLGDTFIWIYDAGQDEEFDKWAHWMPNEDSLSTNLKNVDLMQSTGLKDKTGKLIFEGQIYELKVHGIETHVEFIDCVVKWNDSMCAFGWNRLTQESEQPQWINMNSNILDMKDLGNIYEDPELLEATTSPLKED